MRKTIFVALAGAASGAMVWSGLSTMRSQARSDRRPASRPKAEVEKLKAEVARLQGLAPDQAAVMAHVAYHFTNLWAAAQHDNWPLADFYLGEVRNNVKWAVRTKPIRKGPAGNIDLGAIAQAIDNTQFAALKKAIDSKQKDQFIKTYEETLSACYGCHVASGKPYLRPQKPGAPEVQIINMDPNATWPK